MKIKTLEKSFEFVDSLPEYTQPKPKKPNILFRTLVRIASMPDLIATRFSYSKFGMDRLKKGEPCLYLMNHSSFLDLKIASKILYPKPYNIVSTLDAFVGKRWLMHNIGCTPTTKFVTDVNLVRNMIHILRKQKCSVLMYPEAGYSFDGTSTVLPDSLGQCLKLLKVPVVMIRTKGAFARDPLYNGLRLRKVKVSAEVRYLFSPDEIASASVDELNSAIREQFAFDEFRWQQKNMIRIKEKFRAEGLSRVLYKCPNCLAEGEMTSSGSEISCSSCGKSYTLDEYGSLRSSDGDVRFPHIPDWFSWQRECVRSELEAGNYGFDLDADIYMLVDSKALYHVGVGRLVHDPDGFHLTGFGGKLDYSHPVSSSYSLNADFFWYEIGDMISIGSQKKQFCCFPKGKSGTVTKMRLASEELYKLSAKAR